MFKSLLLGMLVVIVAAPARAQTVELSCRLTPRELQRLASIGYDNSGQVLHLSVDKHARKVTVWQTSPTFPEGRKSTYTATFAGTKAAWTIGKIGDVVPPAHDSVDFATNVLTTVNPDDRATQWNCSGS